MTPPWFQPTWALLLAFCNGLLLLEIPLISSWSLVMLLVKAPSVSMILALSSAFIVLFFSSFDMRSCKRRETARQNSDGSVHKSQVCSVFTLKTLSGSRCCLFFLFVFFNNYSFNITAEEAKCCWKISLNVSLVGS